MNRLFSSNRLYFFCFILFLLLGGILLLNIDKGELILFFNERRTVFGDFFFKYFTKMGEEPAYILAIIALLFVRIRHAFLIPLLGVVVTLLSYGLKSYFQVYRPITFFKQERLYDTLNLVEGVDLYSGANSFPSGHTMSGFALYGLLAFLLPMKKAWGFIFFLCAFLVGLSRVYLVQHFWQDVFVGAVCGVILAMTFWWIQNQLNDNPSKWWNRAIHEKKKHLPQV